MKKSLTWALSLLLLIRILFRPELASAVVLEKLIFFGTRIFPSLFLFVCLSPMLLHSPNAYALYRFPFGVEITVFLLGTVCGFPLGAVSAVSLYEAGLIDRKRASVLCGGCNGASVPFLIGVCGGNLFSSIRFGIFLAAAQAVCGLFSFAVLHFVFRPSHNGISVPMGEPLPKLTACVKSATETMLTLCGVLVFFGAVAELLAGTLPLSPFLSMLLRGGMEFSLGVSLAASAGNRMLACLFVGWSGVCVYAQVASVTRGKLSLRPYVLAKLLSGGALMLLCALFY